MSNFEIILIEPNSIEITDPFSLKFHEELLKCTKIVKVNNETLMEKIGDHLKMNETGDFMGNTELCYETHDKKIYEICYIDIIENKIEPRGENILASQLLCVHKKIDGPVALFGYKVNIKTGLPVNIPVKYDELKDILINKFMHKGVYIHSSNNMVEFTFYNDLNVLIPENQTKELQPRLKDISILLKTGIFFEFSVYTYNLIIVTPKLEYDNLNTYPTNKIISLFLDKLIAKGDFIIFCKISQNDYTNFSIKELKQMVYLYNNKNLKTDETKIEKIDNIQVIKNKHMLLYNKFKEYRGDQTVAQLMDNNNFNKFVENTFEIFKENTKHKDTIFNIQVFDELEKTTNEKTKKQEILNELLDKNGLAISEEIEIN